MEPKYITEQMLDEMKGNFYGRVTDLDVLRLLARSMKCENVVVYDKVMDYCSQLHIGAFCDRENLTITT